MRPIVYSLLFFLFINNASAQYIRPDLGAAVGYSYLRVPYSGGANFGLNLAGHINYVRGHFMGGAGLGAALLSEKQRFFNNKTSELFAEFPIGIAFRGDLQTTNVIVGLDASYLYLLGGSGGSWTFAPHIDLLWQNHSGGNNGLFLKLMVAADRNVLPYAPMFAGIGYKVLFPPDKKKGKSSKRIKKNS